MAQLTASPSARAAAAKRGLVKEPEAPLPQPKPVALVPKVHERGERACKLVAELRERWPLAFAVPPKPLAIGIYQQIISAASEFRELHELSSAMWWWTTRLTYVEAMSRGGERINLDGSVAGPVSESHREGALERLRLRLLRARRASSQSKTASRSINEKDPAW